ncbi:hypothetical protein NP590_12995 [Methylomonas sp. SURF-2]|uniref:Peptidoglycan binding-like domain-containing protein n=1 Tax=Methylomonas subterranea TaxID=2952225 RepID=A0ABT1THU3_9GAMM|nr:hypothetical protein [Methylomonas sp. SURF-2]MCQ8105026.1 hypothetical protein [Methylomonas sp. SURF-2]
MNIIHSSSLAAYPVGFHKPEQDRFTQKPLQPDAFSQQATDVPNKAHAAASTPEQIKTALADAGLNPRNPDSQGGDANSNKAMQAYQQSSKLAGQQRLENLISRVDYYA